MFQRAMGFGLGWPCFRIFDHNGSEADMDELTTQSYFVKFHGFARMENGFETLPLRGSDYP